MSHDEAFEQAHVLFRRGQTEGAIALLRQLNNEFPTDLPVLGTLATFLVNVDSFQEAIPYLRQAIDIEPSIEALKLLGAIYVKLGDCKALHALAQDAHALIWDDAEIVAAWGYALWLHYWEAQSLPFLERAVELAPDNLNHHRNLAAALVSVGQEEEAVQSYSRSVTPWTCGGGGST